MVYIKSISSLIRTFCISILLLFSGKTTAHARDREEDTQADSTNQVIIDFSTLDSRSFFNGSNSPSDPGSDSSAENSNQEKQPPSDADTTGTKPDPQATGEPYDRELERSTPDAEVPQDAGLERSGQQTDEGILENAATEQQRILAEQNRILEEQRRRKDAELLQRELAAANQIPETKGCLSVVALFIAGSATGAFSLFRLLI